MFLIYSFFLKCCQDLLLLLKHLEFLIENYKSSVMTVTLVYCQIHLNQCWDLAVTRMVIIIVLEIQFFGNKLTQSRKCGMYKYIVCVGFMVCAVTTKSRSPMHPLLSSSFSICLQNRTVCMCWRNVRSKVAKYKRDNEKPGVKRLSTHRKCWKDIFYKSWCGVPFFKCHQSPKPSKKSHFRCIKLSNQ